MAAYDLAALKAYVQDAEERNVAPNIVLLDVTHNLLTSNYVEISFDKQKTVLQLKEKIYRMTGSKPAFMRLSLCGVPLDEHKMLGFYGPKNGDRLHCEDTDPFSPAKGRALEDTSLVKKFEISEEKYAKIENSVRALKQKEREKRRKEMEANREPLDQLQKRIPIDSRCEVNPGGKRGQVMYVGEIPEIKSDGSHWVGVKYDEPYGKNDGSIKGKRYFDATMKFGGFVRPQALTVGDFPARDLFDDDDEDSD